MKVGDTIRVGTRGGVGIAAATLEIIEFCDDPNSELVFVKEVRDMCPEDTCVFGIPNAWWDTMVQGRTAVLGPWETLTDEELDQVEHKLLTKLERVRSTKSKREKTTRPIVLAVEKTAKVMVRSTEFVRSAGVTRVHFCCGGPIAVVERIHPAQYVPGDTACARATEDDTMQIWRCRYVLNLGLRWETEEPYTVNAVLQRISACDLMVILLSERVPWMTATDAT